MLQAGRWGCLQAGVLFPPKNQLTVMLLSSLAYLWLAHPLCLLAPSMESAQWSTGVEQGRSCPSS